MFVLCTCCRRGSHARCRSVRGDGGYATAEAAVALPSLLIVMAMAVWVIACVGAQLRCVDAARVAARVAARGDSVAASVAAGRATGPRGARVTVTSGGSRVVVVVQAQIQPFGMAVHLPSVHVQARAVAEREDAQP